MRKKTKSIPVNHFGDEFNTGISIERICLNDFPDFQGEEESERHDRHSFFLLETGMISIEIDFENYEIKSPSVLYMHPNQVHRITAFENVTVSSWAINNENLNPEYLRLLENITPTKPLALKEEMFSLISETTALCLKFSERKNDRLYHSLLKDSCNALVALVTSQFLAQGKSPDKFTRDENISRAFREILSHSFTTLKSPAAYAKKLNLTTSYLNKCVKNITGFTVSHHIQQRVVLEAKRMLHHSDQSVKEIAAALGYDDYPYFSRLFSKNTRMTPLAFRQIKHE